MTVNPFRGEIEIEIAGRKAKLRRSFACLLEIEDGLGLGLVPLSARFMARSFGLREVAVIVQAGLRAAGENPPAFADLGEKILQTGLMKFSAPLSDFLLGALTGGEEPDPGEAPAAGSTSSTTAA
ncbi:MAG: gene transfer agent family protein [Alphaproteobacteria bacterium]|nr:gene transfer agent family protein [Alphaproteobacteria bacterium]